MPTWWRAALDLLLPPACAGCGGEPAADWLCGACRPPAALDLGPAPAPLAAWLAATTHGGSAAEWVKRFKYPARGIGGLDLAAEAVALALARDVARRAPGPAPHAVVPVPLHPRRLRERGFSPAAVAARAIAREARAPFAPALIERLRDTQSQTHLSRAERRRNVAGAFAARAQAPRVVWLVDDVVTTGSTLREAALALRQAGAREITALCLASRPLLG